MMKTSCVIIFRVGRVKEFPKQIEKCFYGLVAGYGHDHQAEPHGFIKIKSQDITDERR